MTDPNYRFLRELKNCREYDIACAKAGMRSSLITEILTRQATAAMQKADQSFVKLALGV